MKIKIEFDVDEKDLPGSSQDGIAYQINKFIEERLEVVRSSDPTGGKVYALTGTPIGRWEIS